MAQGIFIFRKYLVYDDVIPLMSSSWRRVEQERYKFYTEMSRTRKRVVLELQRKKGNDIKTLVSIECRGHLQLQSDRK